MKSAKNRKFNKRAIVSTGLLIMFIFLPISGKMIEIKYDNPHTAHIWGAIHYTLGFLFTIFGIFHIVYNRKSLKSYLKIK